MQNLCLYVYITLWNLIFLFIKMVAFIPVWYSGVDDEGQKNKKKKTNFLILTNQKKKKKQ